MARNRLIQRRAPEGTGVTSLLRRRRRRGSPVADDFKSGELINTVSVEDTPLISMLRKAHPSSPFRAGEYTHVSDILHKCARMIALHYRTKIPLSGKVINDSLGLCFAQGDSIHDYIKNKVSNNNPGCVYGNWTCRCGHTRTLGIYRHVREQICEKCEGTVTVYDEFTLKHDDTMLVGNVDLTLNIDDALFLNEIKSINKKAFDGLVRPLPEHRDQILIYWRMARELGYALHDKVSILYASKDFIFGNPYKEFVFKPADYLDYTDDYFEAARQIKAVRASRKSVLPNRICPNASYKPAKECELVGVCFDGDE